MPAVEITKDIYWVGVHNPGLRIFDVMMRTEWGTSYNSYLIKGASKTAVVDSVKEGFTEEFIRNIADVCDISKIGYIVCNHTEPDHSGSLSKLLDLAPDAVVLCSKPASVLLRSIMNRDFECRTVGDGDSVDLGGRTLQFISAPFLHWPDSIFTYVPEEGVLLSGDVFGFHFSAQNVFDDLTPLSSEMAASQKYYFDVIMGPFKSYVLQAVDKIRGFDIKVIGPSHGPVLRRKPQEAIERYKTWASDILNENSPKKVYVGYVSCYGYTRMLAERIASVVKNAGYDAQIEDVSQLESGACAAKIHRADAFAIGSPTINRDALKPIWDVLTSISAYTIKGKPAVVFGSFGWSGEAIRFLSERLRDLGAEVLGSCSARLYPDDKELAEAEKIGKTLCEALEK